MNNLYCNTQLSKFLNTLTSEVGMTDEIESVFLKHKFHLYNADSGYFDFQLEQTYLNEEDSPNGNYHSLNTSFTFDCDNQSCYMVVGINTGGGLDWDFSVPIPDASKPLDELIQMAIENSCDSYRTNIEYISGLFKRYDSMLPDLLLAMKDLSSELGIGSVADQPQLEIGNK